MPPGYVSLAHTPEREREQAEAEQRYANCDQVATQFVSNSSPPMENAAPVMAGLLLYGLQTGYAYTRASALPYDSGAMLFGTGLMLTASDEYSIHAYDSRLP